MDEPCRRLPLVSDHAPPRHAPAGRRSSAAAKRRRRVTTALLVAGSVIVVVAVIAVVFAVLRPAASPDEKATATRTVSATPSPTPTPTPTFDKTRFSIDDPIKYSFEIPKNYKKK